MNELLVAYLHHAREFYGTRRTYGSQLSRIKVAIRPLKRRYGLTSAAAFGPLKLQAVRQQFVDEGFCRSYVNDNIRVVKQVFAWATRQELIPASVHHGLTAVTGLKAGESPAPEPTKVKPLPEAYVDAVLPIVSRQVAAMIRLQLLTGARPGEMVIMRACDIDMGGKIWTFKPSIHKGDHLGHERAISLGPKAQAIVREFLKPQLDVYLFSPKDARADYRNGVGRIASRR